ncbi:MAG: protein kinase [Armatimonadota bacterium]|nr:protein kinase [Armatimonadota bacterium]MDR5696662.1 protein kinase [Armatimonadota bacterium]
MPILRGQIVAKAYEILDTVGQGGMATVFRARRLADDAVVALKVLRDQYAHDREFVERFQREARAVAQLVHPNVVPVLDSGHDGGVHYIVMEFVEGEDLKAILRRAGALDPERAVRIAAEVCRALEYAHGRGIVHRDIKPQNILITRNGQVKVTDFGIARAISSSTITETGTVLGSVQYLSPEQARGEAVTAASDLYALGCVLYEMLTGTLPFDGESPIAIALKHIYEEPPPPRAYNPRIPARLEGICRRALAKSPAQRYASAEQMRDDLEGRTESWREMPTAVARAGEATALLRPGAQRRRAGRWRPSPLAVASALLALVAVAMIAGWQALNAYVNVGEVTVPDLRGRPFEEAQALAVSHRLQLVVARRDFSDRHPMNAVIDQDPPPGQRVRENRIVSVIVSQGPQMVEVPDVTRRSLTEARFLLDQARLRLGEVREDYDDQFPRGFVVSQDPQPLARVARRSPVNLIVSKGPELVAVPDLVGRTLEEARAILHRIGIALGRVGYAPRDDVEPGRIAEQSPAAGGQMRSTERMAVVVATRPVPTEAPTPAPTPAPEQTPQSWAPDAPSAVVVQATAEPVEEDVRRVRIEIQMPPGAAQELRIVVIDVRGVRVAYSRVHLPGQQVTRVVEVRGYAIVQVYVGGRFVEEIRP